MNNDKIIFFTYGPMKAGKTRELVDMYNRNGGVDVLVIKPAIDTRTKPCRVQSRDGDAVPCIDVQDAAHLKKILSVFSEKTLLVDEAQFFSPEMIKMMVKDPSIENIFFYGLLTDYRGDCFKGSLEVLKYATYVTVLEAECDICKSLNATMNLNPSSHKSDDRIVIGDEEYLTVCHDCFDKGFDLPQCQ